MLVLSEISYINLLAQWQAYTRYLINMNFLSSDALKEVIIWLWKEHYWEIIFFKRQFRFRLPQLYS